MKHPVYLYFLSLDSGHVTLADSVKIMKTHGDLRRSPSQICPKRMMLIFSFHLNSLNS